jgi:hypothetical protein
MIHITEQLGSKIKHINIIHLTNAMVWVVVKHSTI